MNTWMGNPWSYAAAAGGIDNSATAVTIKAAVAGNRNYITSIQISHATLGAATELAVRNGAGGAVLWRLELKTAALPPVSFTFPVPLMGSVNTLLEVVTLTGVTGDVMFNAQGYCAD